MTLGHESMAYVIDGSISDVSDRIGRVLGCDLAQPLAPVATGHRCYARHPIGNASSEVDRSMTSWAEQCSLGAPIASTLAHTRYSIRDASAFNCRVPSMVRVTMCVVLRSFARRNRPAGQHRFAANPISSAARQGAPRVYVLDLGVPGPYGGS